MESLLESLLALAARLSRHNPPTPIPPSPASWRKGETGVGEVYGKQGRDDKWEQGECREQKGVRGKAGY